MACSNDGRTYEKFQKKVWLSVVQLCMDQSPCDYVKEAYETNWMSTVGANINEVEKLAAETAEAKYAVGHYPAARRRFIYV